MGAQSFYGILDEEIDARLLALSMLLLLIFVLTIEHSVHHINAQSDDNNRSYHKMLRKVYSELMIMGIISFCVLLIHDIIAWKLTPQFWVHFELVHVAMFIAAIFYVLHAFVFMRITQKATSRWMAYERTPVDELLMLSESAPARTSSSIKRWAWGRGKLRGSIEFHLLRMTLTRSLMLPRNFTFDRYMQGVLSEVILEHMEIKVHSWLLALAILGACALVDEPGKADVKNSHLVSPIIGWITFCIAWGVLIAVRRSRDYLIAKLCEGRTVDEHLRSLRMIPEGNVNKKNLVKLIRSIATAQLPFWVMNARTAYPLGKPWVLHFALDLIMLSQCFTLTISFLVSIREVFINFDASAAAVYTILDLVPQVLILLVISPRVLKNIACLHAIAQPSLDVIERVLGEMDDVERLRGQLEECVKSSLKIAMRDCDSELKTGKKKNMGKRAILVDSLINLFEVVDESGRGMISRENFDHILRGFEMHVEKRKVALLFSAVSKGSPFFDIHDFLEALKVKDWDMESSPIQCSSSLSYSSLSSLPLPPSSSSSLPSPIALDPAPAPAPAPTPAPAVHLGSLPARDHKKLSRKLSMHMLAQNGENKVRRLWRASVNKATKRSASYYRPQSTSILRTASKSRQVHHAKSASDGSAYSVELAALASPPVPSPKSTSGRSSNGVQARLD